MTISRTPQTVPTTMAAMLGPPEPELLDPPEPLLDPLVSVTVEPSGRVTV